MAYNKPINQVFHFRKRWNYINKIIEEISKIATRNDTDCDRDELNKNIRKKLEKELNKPPSPRELEIRQILKEEKEKWESDKIEFEANPLHWSNNKRRRNGLPVLRGSVNRSRATKFHSFKPTPRAFFYIEDLMDEILPQKLDGFFNQFVEIKDMSLGDSNIYYM